MRSERLQRQIDRLLDEAEAALKQSDWAVVRERAQDVLAFEAENGDARAYLTAAERRLRELPSSDTAAGRPTDGAGPVSSSAATQPTFFAGGRYEVKRFLGEGGKKRVYLAHDRQLDRQVAFALIKTEGLDEVGRERVRREAQAMGRLGAHPHIVAVFDLGEESGQPYIVTELMGGGDVEGLIENAPDHRVPLARAIDLARGICQGLAFAHSQHIVHRDLKPGNVWLTADGVPKLGDFGLAVATDRARLTQAGLMVGTVSYMPPEQAMGGEVTPRSDLYSLGAMLYELVCGRPPFVGDESVAIISQHLNTPPISPSWHVPDLPPHLEALILRLLEKDPGKRPTSATEVQEALSAVATGGALATALPSLPFPPSLAPPILDPLYGKTFVGREPELRQLQSAFDVALAGQGALAMVVGEPGIGKTSLCEQLATYVALRGGRALVGHCYEEGSLSLPYLPFVEAMRSYVLVRPPEALRDELGTGAAEVARLVSEIRDRLPVELRPPGDPDDDRWRLFQAVTGFLRHAASVQPLLIVLEDLHDADRGTIDLLLHLARQLPVADATGRGARLLLVGTYRDVEVDRSHPLSGALAELRRSASFRRVPLRGLTVDEVQRMMSIVRGQEVPWSRAETVHRQTEGNPLFVQEVLRYLVEEGIVVRQDGRYVLTDPSSPDSGIPEGLRDVVGKRLSRLSETTNQLLSMAAVIGREFRLDVLQRVAGLAEEVLYRALEEAAERAVVEQRQAAGTVVFRFTHAFFRQTLYEEIFIPRRIRLHQQVGKALEEIYARRLEEHAAELAEHFVQSTEAGDLAKALRYSQLAAQRAMQVFAYGEAVRHLEQALRTQDVLDPDDRSKRCDLLLAQMEAMLPQEDPGKVAELVAPEAFALAEALSDADRAARVAVLACEAIHRSRAGGRDSRLGEWAARADRHARPRSAQRVYAEIYSGMAEILAGRPPAAHVHLRRAIDDAFGQDDNALIFAATGWAFRNLRALQDRDTVQRLARDVLGRSRDGVRTSDLGTCLFYAGTFLLSGGDRAGAESVLGELALLAKHTRDATLSVQAMIPPAFLAHLDGRIEEALSIREAAAVREREQGVQAMTLPGLLHFYLGRGSELGLDLYAAPLRPVQAHRALILAMLGRHDEARVIQDRFPGLTSETDESAITILMDFLVVATLAGDTETVRGLLPRLAPLAGQFDFSLNCAFGTSIGLALGDGAMLLGQLDEARAFYDRAREACEKVRFRPELALTRLAIAELLLKHEPDKPAEAQAHLDFAIEELREMKMQPALERALRHKGLLHA